MKLSLRGQYRDTIRDPEGRASVQTPPRANLVVYRALDLMAGLLRNQPGLGGILYWAVGTGDPGWDEAPPPPDRRTTQLVNEIYRKPVDPARHITYNADARTLVIRITFEADEGVGVLREFGLFGGDASARPNSGYLINHGIHPPLDKTQPMALVRELRLTLSSDTVVSRALDLVAGLLGNQPGLGGIQYWAVGAGDPSWDEAPLTPDREVTQLVNEIYRKPVDPARHITYDEDTRTLVVRGAFAFDEAVGVLREFGLLGGNASPDPGSGYLMNHKTHPAIDKTRPLTLEREFRLTLGAEVVVEVPDLIGLTVDAAQTALETKNLTLGAVLEAESEEGAGRVIEQDPPAGKLVSEGTAVDVTVAVSIRVDVPDVRGLTPADATRVLADIGLALSGEAPPTEESPATPGTIIRQTPPAGARVDPGTVVQVVLATPITTLVPDLTGLTAGEAAIVLRGADLTLAPAPHPIKESSAAPGTVVTQDPAAGERVPLKTAVTITLAALWTVEVPDLTGLTPEDAAEALRQAAAGLLETLGRPLDPPGLALGAQTTAESEAATGTIIGQKPAADDRAPLYGTVAIVLATPITAQVPNLIGLDRDAASEALNAAGLTMGTIKSRPDVARAGTVIEQEPRAEVRAPRGSAVKVVLAEPILVQVPDLVGRTLDYAQEVVLSRGLVLGEPTKRVSDQREGTILEQDPKAGERAALNSTVNVVIASRVPDVVGLPPEAAGPILAAVGLVLAKPPYPEEVSNRPVGTIVRQNPKAGATAAVGDIVSVVLATRVPNVVGLPWQDVGPVLKAVGLTLETPPTEEESDEPRGTIIRQNPAAGSIAAVGDRVRVVVAIPRTVAVPSVLGLSLENARSVLAQVGLALAMGAERESDQPAGTVLEQTPAAGQRVTLGSTVTVVVAVPRTVVVPSVVGLSLENARSALAQVGLALAMGAERESDQPAGTVLEQTPAAGQRVTVGSTVSVVVAVPRTVAVPSVVGLGLENARSVLAQVGLALAMGAERESDQPAGTVLEQTPAAGQRVTVGSTVTVVVARARALIIVGALGQEPDRLYIHATSMLAAGHVLQALYDGPFDQRNYSYQPVILEEIPDPQVQQVTVQAGQIMVVGGRIVTASQNTTASRMRVTFRLRDGLHWEDGTPVTARDSVFSFELARHNTTPTSKLRINRTASYKAADDRTVVWTGLPGWTDVAYVHNFWTPLPRHLLAGQKPHEIATGEFSRRPVGYGPFRLEKWAEGDHLILERHPAYFRAGEGLPRADRVALRLIPDSHVLLELLLAGELDMALVGSLGFDQLPVLRQAAEAGRLALHVVAGNAQEYLVFGIDKERTPFFQDMRVRQAIALGIDRQRIVEQVLSGGTVVGDSFVPPDHPMHGADLPRYGFDPDRARALLAEAGWANGFAVVLLVPAGRGDRAQVAEIIKANLADLAIRVELQFVEARQLYARGKGTPLFGRQFDLALVGWVAGVEPPAELFLCEEVSGDANGWGGPNISGYCSDAFDAATLAAMSTVAPNERRALWAQAQRVFARDLPAIPLFQHIKVAATRPGLAGFALDPSQPSEMWNVEEFV